MVSSTASSQPAPRGARNGQDMFGRAQERKPLQRSCFRDIEVPSLPLTLWTRLPHRQRQQPMPTRLLQVHVAVQRLRYYGHET